MRSNRLFIPYSWGSFASFVVIISSGGAAHVSAQSPAQETHTTSSKIQSTTGTAPNAVWVQLPTVDVTLNVRDSSLAFVLRALAKQANMRVAYDSKNPVFKQKISITFTRTKLPEALRRVLHGTGLQFVVAGDGETLVVRPVPQDSVQATRRIFGTVVDSATGKPIQGVSVQLVGRNSTILTDAKGGFTFPSVEQGQYTVTVRMLGYTSAVRQVTVGQSGTTALHVRMASAANQLSGVVTTATGIQRKVEVGNDITRINVDSVVKNMPVTNLSDLLTGRVPGMNVAMTSGAPGAPSKIRVRGISSIDGTNDPIIIVDGIRVYSAQANTGAAVVDYLSRISGGGVDRSTNMAGTISGGKSAQPQSVLAGSPIDMIDPNSIETIEVLKGPSAVALHGTDAANGVIVITTKKGRAGPSQFNFSVALNTETLPGKWPNNYFMWGMPMLYGEVIDGAPIQCLTTAALSGDCRPDSLMTYQILNDPKTTAFGRGLGQIYRGDYRGGSSNLTYSLSGSMGRTLGYLKMPDVDVRLLEQAGERVPQWQRRPQEADNQSGTARVDAKVSPTTDISVSSAVSRNYSRNTPLTRAIEAASSLPPAGRQLSTTSPTTALGTGLLQYIPDFRKKIDSRVLGFRNSIDGRFNPKGPFNAQMTVGVDYSTRKDMSIMDRSDCADCGSSLDLGEYEQVSVGEYSVGQGNSMITSFRLDGTHDYRVNRFLSFRSSIGGNYTRTVTNDFIRLATDLPKGAVSGNSAAKITTSERVDDRISAGMYVQTQIGIANRMYIPLAMRFDAASGISSNSTPKFPKLSLSYVLSDEPGFQSWPLMSRVSTLRIRTAYGQAAVQPSIAARLRGISEYSIPNENGTTIQISEVTRIGNGFVRPERSSEIEGGFDIGFLDSRLELTATYYRKITNDALVREDLPPSLGYPASLGIQRNVGQVLNQGLEMTAAAQVISTSALRWSLNSSLTTQRGKLLKLGLGKDPFLQSGLYSRQRYVVGYPLNGRWALPIVGYTTQEINGGQTLGKVILGDSQVYLGAPLPTYTFSLTSDVSLFQNVSISAEFLYEHGKNQFNQMLATNWRTSQPYNDPFTPVSIQAYYSGLVNNDQLIKTDIGAAQVVSTLRFSNLSLWFHAPRHLTSMLPIGKNMSIGLQGKNLALLSNYRGKDPNVSNSMSDIFRDFGAIPQPRSWTITFRVN